MDPDVKKAICTELREMFNAGEFLRFFADLAADLRHELPPGLSLTALIDEAVELLERRDRIDAAFFGAWQKERPKRAERIAELAAMAGCTPGAGQPGADPRDEPAAAETSTALSRLSPLDLVAGAYFIFMIYDSKGSPQRALLVSGSFLLAAVLPAALQRGRVAFVVTLFVGAGMIACGKILESRRPSPTPA